MDDLEDMERSWRYACLPLFFAATLFCCIAPILRKGPSGVTMRLSVATALVCSALFPKQSTLCILVAYLFLFPFFYYLPGAFSVEKIGVYVLVSVSLWMAAASSSQIRALFMQVFLILEKGKKREQHLRDLESISSNLQRDFLGKRAECIELEKRYTLLQETYEEMQEKLHLQVEERKVELENLVSLQEMLDEKEQAIAALQASSYEEQKGFEDEKKRLEDLLKTAQLNKTTLHPKESFAMHYSLQKQLNELRQKFSEKSEDLRIVLLHASALKKFEPMYFQLKEQMTQKSVALEQAKARLIEAEEQITHVQTERMADKNHVEKETENLVAQAAAVGEELEVMRQQENELFTLITYLNQALIEARQ